MADNFTPGDRSKIPPIGAPANELKEFVDAGIYYRHRLRASDFSTWRKAELYDQNRQHLTRAAAGQVDGIGNYSQWTQRISNPNSSDYIPLPVLNEGQGVRANESARLGRPNYRPTVTPRGESLEARLAAKDGKDLLRHRLAEMQWPYQSQLFYYHIPLYGGAWLQSEWVNSYDRTTMVPVQTALACPNNVPTDKDSCQSVLASPDVTPDQASKLANGNGLNVFQTTKSQDGVLQTKAKACPTCPDHPPLLPYQPTLKEANEGQDMLGRPLGETKPIGDWVLSVVSPYDMFPRNLGLDMRSGEIVEWTRVSVMNLDALSLLYPSKIKDIKPESPSMLSQVHPIAGSPEYASGAETSFFKDCTRVKQRHKLPWMELQEDGQTVKMNQGRSVIMAGDTVLMDGPLMIQSLNNPDNWIPRVMVDYVPWELRDGGRRLNGFGIWDLMFDAQDGLNECVSQQQAIRQRMAVPAYAIPRSMNLELSSMLDGIPGRFIEYDIDPVDPSARPEVFNNVTAPPAIAQEADFYKAEVSALPGEVEVEKGDVPPNVSAALAIQSLKTYASEKREGRLQRIQISLKRVWKHGLELMAGLYIEPRPVKAEDDDNLERWRMLSGADIKGETEVEVEAEPDFDEKAKDQELLNGFLTNGLLNPQELSPSQKRQIMKIYNAPKELTDRDDLQYNAAQRENIAFRDKQIIPIIDPLLDDPNAHKEEHGKFMNSEFFRNLCEKAQWRERALPILNPQWDMLVQQAVMEPAQPMVEDKTQPPTIQTQVNPMTGQPEQVEVPVMIPAGPPSDLQTRIVNVWTQELIRTGVIVQPGAVTTTGAAPVDVEALNLVLGMYAHDTAHEKESELRQQQVQMGQQVAAAPGMPNVAGMAPTTQQTAVQAATPGVMG